MCYYNSVQLTKKKMLELNKHKKEIAPITKTVQSGFSYDSWPIIVADPAEGWKAELAHWEFIPWWINDGTALLESRKKFTTLNATAEKLFESKMYKSAAAARRCLVLSSGFYEWRHFKPVGAKKEQAYPYHIAVQSTEEEPLFYMAGIWQPWTDQSSGEILHSFAIVTTAANSMMQQIHNTKKRMPTILSKELAEEWISPITQERIQSIASYQYPSEKMIAYPIVKDFNRGAANPKEAFNYEELPSLI
ncbi:MAG: SOS response-associated peptidase [Sphingobacteriia bacterium]